ncbi:MAG: carboxymuconolactone decarboxylase family protein [Ilumatobacter sp.]|nr:carboxymuconolactone decarboxylase family protein [Ilumatobacter sp.]
MRLSAIDPDDLTADQQRLYDALSSRPEVQRSGLVGPFAIWMHAPGMGAAMARLGGAVRFESSLPGAVTEVAICSVGAYYRSKFEFAAHRPMALAAGVDEAALDALAIGDDPGFEDDLRAAHAVAMELLSEHRLTDETFADARARFGEQGVVELVTTVGYYSLISLMLNGFESPLPAGMTDPFPD